MKNGFLKERKMREAISYLVPKDKIIKNLLHGMGDPIKSSFWSCEEVYDESIPEREYNQQRAKDLLKESGWIDSDNDGILDQSDAEDGLKKLKLSYVYNSGNVRRENLGLFLREEFRLVGIELELVAREWSVFLGDLARHDFDIFVSAFGTSSFAPDPKQLFHTSSHYGGGSNYMGFGNVESDALISDIRESVNPEIYVPKLKELQKNIYEEIPCVYLYSIKNRVILNKRLNTDKVYINTPGYWDGQFKP
jgi:ABC-type transport system substrate-binding protein